MNKTSKILLILFLIGIAVSVYFLYERSFVQKDFEIYQDEQLINNE